MHFDFVIPVLPYAGDAEFYDRLTRRLNEHGCTVGLITLDRKSDTWLRDRHAHVFYMYEQFAATRHASFAEIERVELQYRLGTIADHVYPEQKYFGGSTDELATRAVYIFRYLEAFLERHTVEVFINNTGGEIIRRSIVRLTERTPGAPPRHINIDLAPFHGRVALSRYEVGWDDLPSEISPLSSEARNFVERLVAEATSRRQMFAAPQPLGLDFGSLYRPVRNIVRQLLSDEQRDEKLSYVYRERVKTILRRVRNPRLYEDPVAGEPYIFFPLHVPFDSAITIRAPQFQHQDVLLEFLAERCLPTGIKLYVKPHPGGLNTFSTGMLRRIARLRNVRLVNPLINSHQLIEGSRAVVVITSTAGFESLLYFKPVILLGKVFYRGRGITHDVDYLGYLPHAVRRALDAPPDRDSVLAFIHAAFHATYPGAYPAIGADVDALATSLLHKAQRLLKTSWRTAPVATTGSDAVYSPDPSARYA